MKAPVRWVRGPARCRWGRSFTVVDRWDVDPGPSGNGVRVGMRRVASRCDVQGREYVCSVEAVREAVRWCGASPGLTRRAPWITYFGVGWFRAVPSEA